MFSLLWAFIVSPFILEIGLDWCGDDNCCGKKIILLSLRLFLPGNILDNFLYSKLFNMFLESAEVYCVNLLVASDLPWKMESIWFFVRPILSCFLKTPSAFQCSRGDCGVQWDFYHMFASFSEHLNILESS